MEGIDSRLSTHSLSKDEVTDANVIRSIASDLLISIEGKCPPSRERSLSVTKLEECVMWAVKSIASGGES